MEKRLKKIFLFSLLAVLSVWFFILARIYYFSNIDNRQRADAIIVLGASQWNGEPSPVFRARLDQAVNLYREGLSGKIILTGGVGEGEETSEAVAGKNYLIKKGIDGASIFMEEKGRTTLQSLNEAEKILKEKNLNSVILVSDGFHIMRLGKMAKDIGLEYFYSPVKNGPIDNNWRAAAKCYVRESAVYILYLFFKV
ncbi:MAG: YdcF family protein [Patescibacteria group bacterium]|jgi:uncharacterized SAM-binding protein YcdF (DUF218 family)